MFVQDLSVYEISHPSRALRRLGSALACVLAIGFACSAALGGPSIELGNADNIALDQPVVAIEVLRVPAGGGNPVSLGPQFANTFLLDTGSSTLLAAAEAIEELNPNGYQTVAQYDEQGLAGFETLDVSAEYRLDYAGTDGVRHTLPATHILSSPNLNFGGFSGIIGMPAMVGHNVQVDMRGWIDGSSINLQTLFLSAPPVQQHQYIVPLTQVTFPLNGQHNPNDPLPTSAPLSFAPVSLHHGSAEATGQFLVDTGAQISIISSSVAFALGLDANNNGTFDDEKVAELPIGGIGGTVNMPILELNRMGLRTSGGVDLDWTNLNVGVVDIDPQIAGIFGMDLLTSGWIERVILGTGPTGYVHEVDFDFRNDGQWRMLLTIRDDLDQLIVPEPAALVTALVGLALIGGWSLHARRRKAARQRAR